MPANPVTSPLEARQSLDAAAAAERRVSEAIMYGRFGPFLILWGIVWIAAFTGTYLRPAHGLAIWLIASAIGWLGSFAIGFSWRRADSHRSMAERSRPWLTAIALFAYAWLWPVLLYSGNPNAVSIYAGTFTGFAYVLVGIWRGLWLTWLGLAVTALFMVGLVADPAWFKLYAALAGGGGLIVAGWLFQRQDLR
jgi:hypothetical protein